MVTVRFFEAATQRISSPIKERIKWMQMQEGGFPDDGSRFAGAELDVEMGRKAAQLAALNVLAVTREHLGSLDKVTRIVRLGVQ